ncbi:MAG TPA: hypothetical protein VIH48_00280 [Candidatus Bathyarchaeia archaeon]
MPTKGKIEEKSRIELEIDGRTIKRGFHDVGDATEKAVNEINKGAKEATITQEIKLRQKKEKK